MCYISSHSGVSFPQLADDLNLVYAQGVNRSDIGSWLLGPRSAMEAHGASFGYRGQRLGLPEAGPGSIAGFGRRLVALSVDWFSSILVVHLIRPELIYGSPDFATVTMGIFAIQVGVLTCLSGASFGQKLLSISIVTITGGRLPVIKTLFRTLLVCLVVPALIWDRDARGFHDILCSSMVVRAR